MFSIEEERRRDILSKLITLQQSTLKYSEDLAALMTTCKFTRHLSPTAIACHHLMKEIVDRVAAVIMKAQTNEPSDDYILKVSDLAKEARKVVGSMEVHVGQSLFDCCLRLCRFIN